MVDTPPPSPDSRPPLGGGAPLAFLLLAGVIIGGLLGQPTIGLLVGLALGILAAVAIWRIGPR
ncbi:MAG TPA: hypothetical protein VFF84_11770 [Sphingobium sp.]|nr:hypothetical protein [Sphingobium sp.]